MIELTNNPEVLYNALHGDLFTLNGEGYMLEVSEGGEKVFLSKTSEDFPWTHVRDDRGVALLTRKELVQIIEYNVFVIY